MYTFSAPLIVCTTMLGFWDLLLLIPSLAISLAIIVPLTGVLVRFRANYNPKGLQLDAEGGAQPHTGPVVQTYFGMMQRVYRIEVLSLQYWCTITRHSHMTFSAGLGWSLQGVE